MRLENPLAVIYIIWSIPLLLGFWVFVIRKRRELAGRFVDKRLWPELTDSVNIRRQHLKILIISAAIMLSLVSLTRPQWGFEWGQQKREALDVIFAVDTSRSMLAEDIRPNRLDRAKMAIKDMVGTLKGDRVGLIAFAGESFVQCPLTSDYDGFLLALNDLRADTIPRGGTSLSTAIAEAVRCYSPVDKNYRALVLISDGEEHEGDAVKAAKEARDEGVRIFCIGDGSRGGAFIPIVDDKGYKEFLKDDLGNKVKSRLNEKVLKEIAFITGGAYVRSRNTEFGLRPLYQQKISRLKKREIELKRQKRYHERFQIPLAIALLLLALELMISERKR
ncbi:MAG: VWA domain-containing protein [Candidatus Omnitrophica bacterium]|nr:VWA domain-containing protein [Candidatus Omnitrophota bacterium]